MMDSAAVFRAMGSQPLPKFPCQDPEKRKQLRHSYLELLRRFAQDSAPSTAAEIVRREACQFEGGSVQFKLNYVSEQVGIFVDIGKPERWQELEVCRKVLELHLHQATPAIWFLGRAPGGHVVLLTHFVMTENAAEDAAALRTQAATTVQVAVGMRSFLFN